MFCGEDYEKRAKITKNANIFFIFVVKNTSFVKENSFIMIKYILPFNKSLNV